MFSESYVVKGISAQHFSMASWWPPTRCFSRVSSAAPLQRQSQRELNGPSRARANAYVRHFDCGSFGAIRRARRVGIDDQVDAARESIRSNLTGGELEDATSASGRNPNSPGPHAFGESENAHLAIQKDHIDGEAHAQRVNAAAGNQQQPLFLGHDAATQQPQAARLE